MESPSPTIGPPATVPIIGTIEPVEPPATSDNPWGLPVHPILIAFWILLVILLIAILLRSLR